MRAFGVYWWGEEAARVRVTGQSGEELVPFRRLKQWSADITQAPVKARRDFFYFNWLTCQLPWSCSFHLFPRVFEPGQPVWWTAWKWWNPQRWNHLFSPVLGEEQKPDFRSEQSHRGHLRGRLPSSASAPWGLLPDEEGFFCAPLEQWPPCSLHECRMFGEVKHISVINRTENGDIQADSWNSVNFLH